MDSVDISQSNPSHQDPSLSQSRVSHSHDANEEDTLIDLTQSLLPLITAPRESSSPTLVPGTAAEETTPSNDELALKQQPSQISRHEPVPERRAQHSLFKDWWLECACCFLVIGALLAVMAVIYSHENRPLPDWPYSITINSIISILVVVMKTAMTLIVAEGLSQLKWTWFSKVRPLQDLALYDRASRGPWGATKLLLAARHRHLTTSVGALIMIGALTLDPFVQQLIKYYDCSRPLIGVQPTLPRTQAYRDNMFGVSGEITLPMSSGMMNAISEGIFTPGTPRITFDCLTGNCTFPNAYDTVGYCRECWDISSDLTVQNATIVKQYTDTNFTTNKTTTVFYTSWDVNYTLPSGFALFGEQDGIDYAADDAQSMVMRMNYNTGNIETIYANGYVAGLPSRCQTFGSDSWQCRGYGAAACLLTPCVRTLSGQIRAGILNETLLSYSTDFSPNTDSFWSTLVDLHCLNSDEKKSQKALGYTFEDDSHWLPYNASFDPSSGTDSSYTSPPYRAWHTVPERCMYEYDRTVYSSFHLYFGTYFLGTVSQNNGVLGNGPQQLQTIFNDSYVNFKTIDETFGNISDSMTVFMRQNGAANYSEPAFGVALQDHTCVRVRWIWLTFPALLAALMLLFFIFMVFETRGGQQGVHHDFKSSLLPLVFHGFDPDTQNGLGLVGTSNEVKDMTADAKGIFVRLSPTEKGWKFIAAQ